MDETLDRLRQEAHTTAKGAHVPYSGRSTAAVLLLADGTWVPGVRVESASFSLVIPALLNAFTTAAATGRTDVVAAVLSRPLRPEEPVYAYATPAGRLEQRGEDVLLAANVHALPAVGDRLDPFLEDPLPTTPEKGVRRAREVAGRAYVPASAFPVGCVLVTESGRMIPGVNVEHPDWSRTLCAERTALGTAYTWNQTDVRTLYLTCLLDPTGTPCGACRQLLAELAPGATLWMDRGTAPPESSVPGRLLPGAFQGQHIVRST